jgi:cardiolipin synthase
VTVRDIPNLITAARILLTIPLAWSLVRGHFWLALLLFAVSGVSDGLDGFLAKHFGWQSRLGSLLDPAADKLMLVTAYVALGWQGLIPLWLVIAVIARDLIIVAGAATYHFLVAPLEGEPTLISKLNTLAQILLVLAVVANQVVSGIPHGLLQAMIWAVMLTTLASGVGYVWIWSQRARGQLGK